MGIRFSDIDEPCDCGSGLKFSECHLQSSLSKEYFIVNVTEGRKSVKHVAYDKDGKEHEIDGIIEMTITLSDPKPWDKEISQIIKPKQNIPGKEKNFDQRSGKLYHKLGALKFHSNTFKNEEFRLINQYQNNYVAENFHYILENPILIYHTESYFFQSKSCLDVLSQIIGIAFKLSVRTYKDDGNDLVDKIKKNPLKGYPKQCDEMITLIKSNEKWIADVIMMRDEVTHYSDLEGLSCFLHRAWNDENIAKIYYPSLPNRERVSKYMDTIWNNITALIRETYKIIDSIYSNMSTIN